MPPSDFFGSLGNTNFLRTHGTPPRSSLNLADDTKVPGRRIRVALIPIGLDSQKVGATVGEHGSPDKRRQLRGRGTD